MSRSKTTGRLWLLALVALMGWIVVPAAQAGDYTWTGASANGTWGDVGNWEITGGGTPTEYPGQSAVDDTARFDGGVSGETVTLGANRQVIQVDFDNQAAGHAGFVISGSHLLTTDWITQGVSVGVADDVTNTITSALTGNGGGSGGLVLTVQGGTLELTGQVGQSSGGQASLDGSTIGGGLGTAEVRLTNADNYLVGQVTVQTGGTLTGTTSGTIGEVSVLLDGGTLKLTGTGQAASYSDNFTLQCEDYKVGGEGVGYHDTSTNNDGGQYRSDDVDITHYDSIGAGNYCVGWTAAGEWLQLAADPGTWTTDPTFTGGTYTVTFNYAADNGGPETAHIEIDGVNVGTFTTQYTGSWENFTTATVENVAISAGSHTVKLVYDYIENGINSDYLLFQAYNPATDGAYGNNVEVASTGTVEVDGAVALGTLTASNMGGPAVLNVTATPHTYANGLSFTGTTLSGDLTVNNAADTDLGALNDYGTGKTITKQGDATLRMTSDGSAVTGAGTLDVEGGMAVVAAGTVGPSPIQLSGGSVTLEEQVTSAEGSGFTTKG